MWDSLPDETYRAIPPQPVSRNAPYTVDEIARWRKLPLADVAKKRRAELVFLMQQPGAVEPP